MYRSAFAILFLSLLGLGQSLLELEELVAAEERFEAKQTLVYGEACSVADQKKVDAYDVKRHPILSTLSSASQLNILSKDIDTFVSSSTGNFCNNEDKNLECQESTGTCGCSVYDKNTVPINATFVRDGDGCRYTSGSTCWPFEDEEEEEETCDSGTSCLIANNRRRCNTDNLAMALVTGRLISQYDTEVQIFRAFYNAVIGGICKCL
jgi:hypothetical protein